jgi:hypothetical protein
VPKIRPGELSGSPLNRVPRAVDYPAGNRADRAPCNKDTRSEPPVDQVRSCKRDRPSSGSSSSSAPAGRKHSSNTRCRTPRHVAARCAGSSIGIHDPSRSHGDDGGRCSPRRLSRCTASNRMAPARSPAHNLARNSGETGSNRSTRHNRRSLLGESRRARRSSLRPPVAARVGTWLRGMARHKPRHKRRRKRNYRSHQQHGRLGTRRWKAPPARARRACVSSFPP